MDAGVTTGRVLSYLVGAAVTWWLSGKSLLLGAVGGLVTAVGLPPLISWIGQIGAPSPEGTALARNAPKQEAAPAAKLLPMNRPAASVRLSRCMKDDLEIFLLPAYCQRPRSSVTKGALELAPAATGRSPR